jgi:hypothetical protein
MSIDVWQNATKDTAGDLILTGYVGEFKDMPVYNEVISLMGSGKSALDFGCGVGRNVLALSKSFNRVTGYDFPSMLDLVPKENQGFPQIMYTTDWDYLKNEKFDSVLASLVFQHIEHTELEEYLFDLNKMTDKLVLHSRTWVDHSNLEVLPIVEKYFIINNIEYTKDPNNPIDDHFIAVLIPRR